jgi:hypothetical protein
MIMRPRDISVHDVAKVVRDVAKMVEQSSRDKKWKSRARAVRKAIERIDPAVKADPRSSWDIIIA